MTNLLYLNNPDLFQAQDKILEILELEKGIGLVFDQTIFYVQGGGQPSDTGMISFNQNRSFEVKKVYKDQNSKVIHWLDAEIQDLNQYQNQIAKLEIDAQKRLIHSQLHSAGHLIDIAAKNIGLNWKPTKGHHYPNQSYVEYESQIFSEDQESLKLKLQNEINNLINQVLKVEVGYDQRKTFEGQALRIVNFAGYEAIGCGGTHVQNSLELAGLTIKKIKHKKDVVKVSYEI